LNLHHFPFPFQIWNHQYPADDLDNDPQDTDDSKSGKEMENGGDSNAKTKQLIIEKVEPTISPNSSIPDSISGSPHSEHPAGMSTVAALLLTKMQNDQSKQAKPKPASAYVPPDILESIWEENTLFLMEKLAFDPNYFSFIWNVINLYTPQTLKLKSISSGKMAIYQSLKKKEKRTKKTRKTSQKKIAKRIVAKRNKMTKVHLSN